MQLLEIMNRDVISVHPEDSVFQAAKLMSRHNIGSLPVCTKDRSLRGIITDRDIVLRCVALGTDPETTPVSEIMTRNLSVLPSSAEAEDAPVLMARRQIRRLPIVEGKRVVGMVTLGDFSRQKCFAMEASQALCEISENIRKA